MTLSDAEMQVIADKLAIRDLLHCYCRGLDRMDRALALSAFHANAELDYGASFRGSAVQFMDWVWPNHERGTRHSHNITNCYVEIDGDRAASESYSYMIMRLDLPNGAMQLQSNGRYLDEWQRRDGRWGIVRRQSVHEFQDMRRIEGPAATKRDTLATRDTSDPSYALSPALFAAAGTCSSSQE
ncbi:MAG: nuclear transport factor 2 family protein [Novosphingobium sp.]|nr:nuclear transport factor 2 family protein [Novosphingobium sp.]